MAFFRVCALLPDEALSCLAAFLNQCESQGKFPSQMKQWRVTFLPKKRETAIAALGDVQPVAIQCSIYRMWASLRLHTLGPALSSSLCTHQCGGVVGPDASTSVTSFQLEFPEEAGPTVPFWTMLRLLTPRMSLFALVCFLVLAHRPRWSTC